MIRQVVVAAGGKGTRLGALAQKYGNKSLVPIRGLPVLSYTIEWLKEVGIREIIVAVNYVHEYRKIEKLFGDDPRIKMVHGKRRTSSAQCLPPLRRILDLRFLFVYGHAPAPPGHLRNLLSVAEDGIVVSLYPTTTQGEMRKPARLSGRIVTLEESGPLFVEPPHVLTLEFARLLQKTGSWGASFRKYQGRILGVRAQHPPEFHYKRDFMAFQRFMVEFLRKKK